MSIDLTQFHEAFFEEALTYLEQAEDDLLALEKGCETIQDFKDRIDSAFRAIHSIKGSAGSLGFAQIDGFSHDLETVFDQLRTTTQRSEALARSALSKEMCDLLLGSVDMLRLHVNAAQNKSEGLGNTKSAALSAQLQAINIDGYSAPSYAQATPSQEHSEDLTERTFAIRFQPRAAMLVCGNDPLRYIDTLAELGKTIVNAFWSNIALDQKDYQECELSWVITLTTSKDEAHIHQVFEWIEDVCDYDIHDTDVYFDSQAPSQAESVVDNSTESAVRATQKLGRTIQVKSERIDELINHLTELALYQGTLENSLANQELIDLFSRLSRQTSVLQDAIMAMRMSPIGHLFARFDRTIRDAKSELGKQVELKIEGENLELDSSLIERLIDPLNHLVRNALDHGIETPADRVLLGKSPSAVLRLKAEQHSNSFQISIADDGKGFNIAAIKERAIRQGLVTANDNRSDAQWVHLIFTPGFSTASEVSRWSGRGVGLDAVVTEIEKIKGTISVKSSPGVGTKFIITIPLTLALTEALIVRVAQERYAFTMGSVRECLVGKSSSIETLPNLQQLYHVREELLPFTNLASLLQLADGETSESFPAIVVGNGNESVVLRVSEILGQRQIVVKSIEKNLGAVKYCSSATVMPDGKVAFVIDANQVIHDVGIFEEHSHSG
jgi:two-component system, chemotaxis family, sensor kinase CheA